jgi:hypothetical protein
MEITTPVTEVSEALSDTVAQIIANAKSAESASLRDKVLFAIEAFNPGVTQSFQGYDRLNLWKLICSGTGWDVNPNPWKSTFKVTVKMDYVKMFSVNVDADDEDEAKQIVEDALTISDVTCSGTIMYDGEYDTEATDFDSVSISDWEVPDGLDKNIEIVVEELD